MKQPLEPNRSSPLLWTVNGVTKKKRRTKRFCNIRLAHQINSKPAQTTNNFLILSINSTSRREFTVTERNTSYVQVFPIQLFYGNILYEALKCRHLPRKLTKTFNRLIRKGYSYNTIVRSLRIA